MFVAIVVPGLSIRVCEQAHALAEKVLQTLTACRHLVSGVVWGELCQNWM